MTLSDSKGETSNVRFQTKRSPIISKTMPYSLIDNVIAGFEADIRYKPAEIALTVIEQNKT